MFLKVKWFIFRRKNASKLHSKQQIARKESNSSAIHSKTKKITDFERIMNFSLDNEIKKLKPKASFGTFELFKT